MGTFTAIYILQFGSGAGSIGSPKADGQDVGGGLGQRILLPDALQWTEEVIFSWCAWRS
jgi:hypothetical protein